MQAPRKPPLHHCHRAQSESLEEGGLEVVDVGVEGSKVVDDKNEDQVVCLAVGEFGGGGDGGRSNDRQWLLGPKPWEEAKPEDGGQESGWRGEGAKVALVWVWWSSTATLATLSNAISGIFGM